jgi:hypothetical protein
MNTLSFCSSSSASASFRASRTVYSLPAAWAYVLLLGRVHGATLQKDDRTDDEAVDVRSRDVAGRNKRAAAMTARTMRGKGKIASYRDPLYAKEGEFEEEENVLRVVVLLVRSPESFHRKLAQH